MRLLYAFLIFQALCVAIVKDTQALEVSLATGFIHLPASSYHYLGYNAHLGFGEKDTLVIIDFGMTPQFSTGTYTQSIYYGSVGWRWVRGRAFIQPYFGIGLGLYVDQVSSSSGIIPSIVTQGGIKIGRAHFGGLLGFSNYLGIYSPSQLLQWTIWPLVNVMGGLYVAF